ncbi:MAG: NUDIX hydrolase [Nitrospirae bacterium]|nr:NUDIX hydrolase [Nitrospirota bacterium]
MTDLDDAIQRLESFILNPGQGLPQEVFLFVSRITPMINADLLIKDDLGRTLLTWRDDGYSSPGWHIPGGIIRYKESFAGRVQKTAIKELGVGVEFKPTPLAINEFITPEMKNRGHFISLLFDCVLTGLPDEKLKCGGGLPTSGQWMWHERCPDNIIAVHGIYKTFIDGKSPG